LYTPVFAYIQVENTGFAKWLEPQNAEVALRVAQACKRRAYRYA
jgi:hypothetical protein